MTVAGYIVAIGYLGVIFASLGLGAISLRRYLLREWQGAIARLAESVLGIAILVVVSELLGCFGAFTRLGVLLGSLAVGLGAWTLTRSRHQNLPSHPPPSPPVRRWAIALALCVSAIAVLHWSGGVQDSFDFGIYRQDSVWYHLPFSAGFVQDGSTWSIHYTDPLALTAWFYPMNSELLHAVGMLATGNDFLSPLMNIVWMVLALLAAWCVGRPYGIGPATTIAAALVLGSDMMQVQAGNAPTDTPSIFFLLACIALLVNANAIEGHLERGEYLGPILVAALAAGLAVGTKITLLAPMAALTVGLIAIARSAARRRVAAVWLGGMLATGGFWYLRNLFHAGNPLPWFAIGPLPKPDQLPLYPRPPHSVASYAGDPGIWLSEFAPRLERTLGVLWPLILLASAAGLLIALARGRSKLERALGATGLFAVAVYLFIPISASGARSDPSGFETNLRYLAPALILGLILLPLQLRHIHRQRLLVAAMATVFLLSAVTSDTWDASQLPGGALYVAAVVAVPVVVVAMWRRQVRLAAVVSVLALSLGTFAILGYAQQRSYLRTRYLASLAPAADSPGFRATPQWGVIQDWARSLSDERVGVVGPPAAFGQYIFYGRDLSNRVRYIGDPGPHGSYLPLDDCVDWRLAINAGNYTYLVVTPASAFGPGSVPQESLWLYGDRAAREILRSGSASVFRIDGPLNPRGCNPDRFPPILRVPGGGFGIPGIDPPVTPNMKLSR